MNNVNEQFYNGWLYIIIEKNLLSLFHGDKLVIFSAVFIIPVIKL